MQHLAIEEQQCRQRLVLRGRCHVAAGRKMSEERLDMPRAEFARMPLVVGEDEPPHPTDIRTFRPQRQTEPTHASAQLIQKARWVCRPGWPRACRIRSAVGRWHGDPVRPWGNATRLGRGTRWRDRCKTMIRVGRSRRHNVLLRDYIAGLHLAFEPTCS